MHRLRLRGERIGGSRSMTYPPDQTGLGCMLASCLFDRSTTVRLGGSPLAVCGLRFAESATCARRIACIPCPHTLHHRNPPGTDFRLRANCSMHSDCGQGTQRNTKEQRTTNNEQRTTQSTRLRPLTARTRTMNHQCLGLRGYCPLESPLHRP